MLRAGRHDAGMYLCGYAVELALKARICRTLKWQGYPGTQPEFRGYQSFRTHDLAVLLHLSGREEKVRAAFSKDWRRVSEWNPELRYRPIGTTPPDELAAMLESIRRLLGAL